MRAAVTAEVLKLGRSRVGPLASLLIVGGLLALLAGITAAVAAGNAEMIAKAGRGASTDWSGLLASSAQVTAAGGMLGFGVVLAWLFAREFAEGTISGLFALPLPRGRIAGAKLVVFLGWVAAVSLAASAGVVALGWVLGYGLPPEDAWFGLARQMALGVLTGLTTVPVAWVASASRSLLGGVASAVGMVVIAQVGTLAGAGPWFPVTTPAIWAMTGGSVGAPQLGLTLTLSAAAAALTCRSWARMRLDR